MGYDIRAKIIIHTSESVTQEVTSKLNYLGHSAIIERKV